MENKIKNLERTRKNYKIPYTRIAHYTRKDRVTIVRILTGKTKKVSQETFTSIENAINTIIGEYTGNTKQIKTKEVLKMLPDECLEKFGLKKHPFLPGDLPSKQLWKNANIISTENQILQAVKQRHFLLVYGDVGTGKSLILQSILKKIEKLPRQILVYISPLFVENFTGPYIAVSLIEKITNIKAPNTNKRRESALSKAILKAEQENKRVALVLDECHRLTNQMLMHLKRFYEGLGVHQSKLAVILIGQPSILGKLEEFDLREVKYRLTATEINPFAFEKEKNIQEYIEHKIKCAGREEPLFSDGAITAISERCETPLQVNILCTNSIHQAWTTNDSLVTEDIVNDI
jgi:type II secretory pathway predicted ATPase ExeA